MGDYTFRHVFDLFRVLCLCPTVTLNFNIHSLDRACQPTKAGVLLSVKIQTGESGQQLRALIE